MLDAGRPMHKGDPSPHRRPRPTVNIILRSAAFLVVALTVAACGSTVTPPPVPSIAPPSVAPSTVAPSIAPPSALPSATPPYPAEPCSPYFRLNGNGECVSDISSCPKVMRAGKSCGEIGAIPAGWEMVYHRTGNALWDETYLGTELAWGKPTTTECSGSWLDINYARWDGMSNDLDAELAGGVARAKVWTPAGTTPTGTGTMTVGPWSGPYASYRCANGTTMLTLFAASNGTTATKIDVWIQSTAADEDAIRDLLSTFRVKGAARTDVPPK